MLARFIYNKLQCMYIIGCVGGPRCKGSHTSLVAFTPNAVLVVVLSDSYA